MVLAYSDRQTGREQVQAMKAVRFHAFGGPGVLRYEDVMQPIPGPAQVRVQVASTLFDDVDSTIRDGSPAMPVQLPHVPCVDVASIIDALGPGHQNRS
jgi:NADPH:quinone reductase-like Zn-dependent oxidoreductase